MIRLYLAIGICALLAAGAFWFRSVLRENDTLKHQVKQEQELRIEAEENVLFQQNLGATKDSKIQTLLSAKKATATELKEWEGRYAALLNKPENREWADRSVPPDIRDSMRQQPDRPDRVRGSDAAREFVERLRGAQGTSAGKDGGVAVQH